MNFSWVFGYTNLFLGSNLLVCFILKDEKKRRKENVQHLVKYFRTERKQQIYFRDPILLVCFILKNEKKRRKQNV